MNVGAGSYLEVNIPMTVGENGMCVSKISSLKCQFNLRITFFTKAEFMFNLGSYLEMMKN